MEGINFKVYDPLSQLIAGGGLVPGSIPGSAIQAGTITNNQLSAGAAADNINAGPSGTINSSKIVGGPFLPLVGGTISGPILFSALPTNSNELVNKDYVDNKFSTPGSISGSVIQTGTVTSTQLASGAAASNLNSGPAGSVSGSIIQPGTVTSSQLANFGAVSQLKGSSSTSVVVTDISLGSGLAMSGSTLLVDTTALSSTFLPLTGGAMTGAISQPLPPVVGNDLTNKTYVDDNYQSKQFASIPNNLAVFGSGINLGQTIDSGYIVDTVLTSVPNVNTLWPSIRIINALQYGAVVYKATSSVSIPPSGTAQAFSAGNAVVGPAIWPNIGSTFSLDASGIATIFNSQLFTCYYKITFSANSLTDAANLYGAVECQFKNQSTNALFGVVKTLKVFPTPPSNFCNEVFFSACISLSPASAFSFSVNLVNNGLNILTIDPNIPNDPCLLIIERFA
jgi:hypothetical protein